MSEVELVKGAVNVLVKFNDPTLRMGGAQSEKVVELAAAPEIYGLHFLLVQVVARKSTAFLQQPKRWSCL